MWGKCVVNQKAWSRIDSELGLVKTCSKCGIEKPASEFWKAKDKPDGLYSSCKKCANKTWREYYHKSDYQKEKGKIYYAKNTDKINIRKRNYYKENKEKFKEKFFFHHTQQRSDGKNYKSGYLDGAGCCLICGEIFPLFLTKHHPFKEDVFTITLCECCHHIADHYWNLLPEMIKF